MAAPAPTAAPSSVCPGYTQVDEFLPDEEYEGEEEVFYVTMDMGNIEPTLVPSSSSYRLIVSFFMGVVLGLSERSRDWTRRPPSFNCKALY